MDMLGWNILGVGIGFLLAGGLVYFLRWRQQRKFNTFLQSVRDMGDEKAKALKESCKEVSELSFRDKEGVMNTVRIVIDPQMNHLLEDTDPEGVIGGSLDDLIAGCKIEEDSMKKVQEFVFSSKAVRNMREAGLEPDEIVTRMLKASGRMPE